MRSSKYRVLDEFTWQAAGRLPKCKNEIPKIYQVAKSAKEPRKRKDKVAANKRLNAVHGISQATIQTHMYKNSSYDHIEEKKLTVTKRRWHCL